MSPLRDPAITPKIKCLFQNTKIKQASFGKHQKLNIHILTENHQNIPIYGNKNAHS
jgi:hypothetical protein